MPETAPEAPVLKAARRPARLLRRVLGAALVMRLQLRPPAPLDSGLILLAWLRRPAIEMPMLARDALAERAESRADRLRRRLDDVYPF
jgi:hypothetical protein